MMMVNKVYIHRDGKVKNLSMTVLLKQEIASIDPRRLMCIVLYSLLSDLNFSGHAPEQSFRLLIEGDYDLEDYISAHGVGDL